ncbi:hypothetical protein [Enorma massiliensis]|mgnify:FL=1|uniref:hypothetical protein n=1 Tax=Enorma massiliensis TaxID=1472761 RepID=UPI003AB5A354
MKTTIESLREDAARRLRRETLSAAAICIVLIMGGALTATENLPALNGTTSTSAFLLGAVMGLCTVAAVVTIKNIVDLRRALSDDRALRHLHAKENDELQAHMEREIARSFVQIMPALAVIAIFVGALVSLEAMAAAAATLVFLSVALLVVKLSYKIRLQGEIGDEAE